MNYKKLFGFTLALIIIVAGGYYSGIFSNNKESEVIKNENGDLVSDIKVVPVSADTEVKKNSVNNYLHANINAISPIDAVLGGSFYITDITWIDDRHLTVEYEDGHIALVGQIEVDLDAVSGDVLIRSFTSQPQEPENNASNSTSTAN